MLDPEPNPEPNPTDVDDGEPIGRYAVGEPLPGGLPAWERLGVGQRCETWLAWSPAMWAPVVVKFPRPHQVTHPRARRSLRREVAASAGNLHPALARLYTDGTDAAVPYLVLEYVDGIALDDAIDEQGAFAPDDVALLAAQLLAGLRTVHARGLVHIDLKPANVVVRDGRPVLLDFGSARTLGAPQPRGALIGSPGYAAPELEAGEPISTTMDLYGLGVTLYEALTGRVAFDPDLPAGRRPALPSLPPSALAALVHRLLDEPGRRPRVDEALACFGDIAAAAGRPPRPAWLRP